MDDLIARIRAAIDEDERVAQQAITPGGSRGEWAYGNRRISDDLGVLMVGHIPANRGRHIVRHDPARVLRQVAADRELLDWCQETIADTDLSGYGQFGSLKDHPNALAITLAVEAIRGRAKAYGIEP